MTSSVQSKTAFIPCPRCGGQGVGTWHPDAGVCYRCHGKTEIQINVQRHLNALRMLRAKYRRLQAELRVAFRSGSARTVGFLAEGLRYTTQDGLRVRAELEQAGIPVR
jgi:hypothetical protein